MQVALLGLLFVLVQDELNMERSVRRATTQCLTDALGHHLELFPLVAAMFNYWPTMWSALDEELPFSNSPCRNETQYNKTMIRCCSDD